MRLTVDINTIIRLHNFSLAVKDLAKSAYLYSMVLKLGKWVIIHVKYQPVEPATD